MTAEWYKSFYIDKKIWKSLLKINKFYHNLYKKVQCLMLDIIKTSKLNIIPTQGGDVFHGIKSSDGGFNRFRSIFFDKNNHVKAWKKHKKMTLNLVVPYGLVKFVFYKEKPSHTFNKLLAIAIIID